MVVLQRAMSWLAPGGRIIAIVPNAHSLHRRLGVKLGMLERETQLNQQDVEIGHRWVYTRKELDRDIRTAGLQTVAKGGIFLKLLANAQMLMFEDDRLIDGMFERGRDPPAMLGDLLDLRAGAVMTWGRRSAPAEGYSDPAWLAILAIGRMLGQVPTAAGVRAAGTRAAATHCRS